MLYRRSGWLLVLGVWLAPQGVAAQGGQNVLAQARDAVWAQAWAEAIDLLDGVIEQDPENLEARYLRGICYGERGKHPTRPVTFLGRGEKDFQFILARDSLYRDVLYQYALLARYRRNNYDPAAGFHEAIRLGHEQIRLKPDLAHAQAGLYKIYWRMLVETNLDKARSWLKKQQTDHAAFFLAEVYRRKGWLRPADQAFERLLSRPTSFSKTALWLGRARTHYAWAKPASAQAFAEQAIGAIASETDALIAFDDIKHIVRPAELDAFNRIEDVAGYRRFFQAFWVRRDPMPAAAVNERMTEHYRRLRVAEEEYLIQGFRAWYNSPYVYEVSTIAPTYALGTDFDDQGIIFIRHGEPDDYTLNTRGPQVSGSWLYEDPLLVFHFRETCSGQPPICGFTPNFSPVPSGSRWGGRITGMDAYDAEAKTREYLATGLTTDRHRWSDRFDRFEIPYRLAAFRGQDGQTLLEAYYAVPLGRIARAFDKTVDTLAVELGLTFHDLQWQRVALVRETKRRGRPDERATEVFERFRLDVPADSYHVALHIRALDAPVLGAEAFGYRARSFQTAGLKMSDLLVADSIVEVGEGYPPSREDFYVAVNPQGVFDRAASVFVYFEVYDLALSAEGRTRYHVTYTLSGEDAGGLQGLPGVGSGESVSLTSMEQEGTASSPVEYVGIDVSEVPAGAYVLTVTVEDGQTGAVVEASHRLELHDE